MRKLARRHRFGTSIGLAIATALLIVPALPAVGSDTLTVGASDGERQQRDSIFIKDNNGFNPANGVRSGSGTASDPFVISGWNVQDITIKDTSAHVLITDNNIQWLTLDWIGGGVNVHHNNIGDLRVNQNVRRTGDATSGIITQNNIGVVGQLRHWDGVFTHNIVGEKATRDMWSQMFDDLPFFGGFRAVNFDGFNGARFENNTIYGFMDARLHGHHHSSSFEDTSHYHGGQEAKDVAGMDHSQRYHQVTIANNKIISDYDYALMYTDTAHSANDRTAASERNEALNKPHVHYTQVHLLNNELVGSGLMVNVFNAKDERHTTTAPGLMHIAGNDISLSAPNTEESFFSGTKNGIYVVRATDIELNITGNSITGPKTDDEDESTVGNPWAQQAAGILMDDMIKRGNVYIGNNSVSDMFFGVRATRFDKNIAWWVEGLRTSGVSEPVYWDDSVPNQPGEEPHQHDHKP